MTLQITLTTAEAIALRDALALQQGRDYDFTLAPLWSQVGDYIYDQCQQGLLPDDVF